jgi:hypothetical protein
MKLLKDTLVNTMSGREEQTISLTIEEVLVLKEWFQVVAYNSNIEERDGKLANKLANFEKEVIEGR